MSAGRKADTFVPVGAADPLPERPGMVPLTAADVRRALRAWDAAVPELAGLLNAKVTE